MSEPTPDQPEAPKRGRPLGVVSEGRRAEIKRLKDQGLTQKQIADQIGITPAGVYFHLKKIARAAQ